MASLPFGTTFRRLLHRIDSRPTGDRPDGTLLARFTSERDETAFTALVARHGPMVLGVCRRVLADLHDAEDAFQATFLVLARKAASLDGTAPLGSWLYTVARNLAIKLRGQSARRRTREKEAGTMPKTERRDDIAWQELRAVLDDELGRLPEKYRAPLVLCHLQGMTHEAAAKELGWPAGSMAKRLARGQELLRERLAGRGVALSTAALLLLMTQRGSAAVSSAMAQGIGKAAVQFIASKPTGILASATAVALAGSALQSVSKFKIAAVLLLGFGIVGVGAGVALVGQRAEVPGAPGERPPLPAQPAVVAKADTKEIEKENEQLRRKLAQPVNLDKGIDPNTPLNDALEFLAERYDLKLQLDEKAFDAHGVNKVGEQPVMLPKMVGVKIDVVLRLLLGQIAGDNGMVGGYRVKNGQIEILPIDPTEPGEDWVSPKLRQRLLRPVAWDKDIPDDMPLPKILELVGAKYGEKITIDMKAFGPKFNPTKWTLGSTPSVAQIEVPPLKLAGQRVSLMNVLNFLTFPHFYGEDLAAGYCVKPDRIEITAAERLSNAHMTILKGLEPLSAEFEANRKIAAVSGKLGQVYAVEIVIEANTPLHEALEFLSEKFDLTLIVDSRAFEAIGIQKVEEASVQLPRQKGATKRAILQALLEQVQSEEWVGSLILHEDFIEIAPLHKHIKQQKPLTKKQLDDFWESLAGTHWRQTVLASETLAQFPEQAVGLVRERVKPVAPADPKKNAEAARWLKDLDSDEFTVRQKATDELEKLGKDAVPVLREQLKGKPPLEVRERVEQLLEKLDPPISEEQLRAVRAIHLLQQIGTPEAERLLETLAKGTPGAVITEKAKVAIQRLRN